MQCICGCWYTFPDAMTELKPIWRGACTYRIFFCCLSKLTSAMLGLANHG